MTQKKDTAIQSALLKCKEAQQRFPYKKKGDRNTNSPYNEAWQYALIVMETVLVEMLPKEEKQIIDACTFGMNKKGGNCDDSIAYFNNYFKKK